MLLLNREGIGAREARSTFGLPSFDVSPGRRPLEVRIRTYSERDRPAIRQLCSDTGFLGKPIDPIFRDRELFADLFTGAYLRHEPDWAFVAEAQGRVIGYLLGSVRKNFDFVLMRNGFPIASKMLCKLLSGRYAYHPRSGAFVRWLLRSGRQEQPKHPANAAHLHLDLDNRYRGRGVAWRLWETYEQKLRCAGVKQCYGAFFSYPQRRPEEVYYRYGFRVFDRKPTTIFQPEISEVEVVCVTKELR